MDRKEVEERFWRKVNKTGDCWLWQGWKNSDGYGDYRTAQKHGIFDSKRAHRISYYFTYGDYDRKLDVCHKCDTPLCVNPNHLFLGTRKDNMQDCVSKGRLSPPPIHKGENTHTAKLDWNKVREIRRLHSEGGVSQVELGKRYGVTKHTINKIVKNINWKE
jgi:hypothetical protein